MDTGILYYGGLMKKNVILSVLLLLTICISFVYCTKNESQIEQIKMCTECEALLTELKIIDENPVEIAITEMQKELADISNIKEKKQWFIKYKQIIEKYSYILDPPETIYDYYSDKDIEILHRIVEAECTGLEFDKKINVANVIFNRINNEKFPDNIEDVVFQKNPIQFSPVDDGRYYSVSLEDDTLLAIEYAFMFPDTTGGALFFEAIWSEKLNYDEVMCDGSHKFYN